MQQNFIIQKQISGGHNLLPHNGYPFSHPHSWEALDDSGNQCIIISRRNDYMPNIRVNINVRQIGGSNAYIDSSPAPLLGSVVHSPASSNPGSPATAPAPTTSSVGQIDSDVIVAVHTIKTPDAGKTIVVGEVFYFDSKLKNLQDTSLRSLFREKAAISVTTHIKPYDFNEGHTYIFANLRDISVSNDIIHATDARMPKP